MKMDLSDMWTLLVLSIGLCVVFTHAQPDLPPPDVPPPPPSAYSTRLDHICADPDATVPQDLIQCGECWGRCGTSVRPEDLSTREQGHLCSCDQFCGFYGDCCQEFEEACPQENRKFKEILELNPFIHSSDDFQCIEYQSNDNLFNQLILTKCSDGSECEFTEFGDGDVNEFVPVFDPMTGLHYPSYKCAACNGATDIIPWGISFSCPEDDTDITQSLKSTDVIDSEDLFHNAVELCEEFYTISGTGRSCRTDVIASCDCDNQELVSLCHSNPRVLTVLRSTNGTNPEYALYKNVYCAICGGNIGEVIAGDLSCGSDQWAEEENPSISPDDSYFLVASVFKLDPNEGLSLGRKPPECAIGEVYVTEEDSCKQMEEQEDNSISMSTSTTTTTASTSTSTTTSSSTTSTTSTSTSTSTTTTTVEPKPLEEASKPTLLNTRRFSAGVVKSDTDQTLHSNPNATANHPITEHQANNSETLSAIGQSPKHEIGIIVAATIVGQSAGHVGELLNQNKTNLENIILDSLIFTMDSLNVSHQKLKAEVQNDWDNQTLIVDTTVACDCDYIGVDNDNKNADAKVENNKAESTEVKAENVTEKEDHSENEAIQNRKRRSVDLQKPSTEADELRFFESIIESEVNKAVIGYLLEMNVQLDKVETSVRSQTDQDNQHLECTWLVYQRNETVSKDYETLTVTTTGKTYHTGLFEVLDKFVIVCETNLHDAHKDDDDDDDDDDLDDTLEIITIVCLAISILCLTIRVIMHGFTKKFQGRPGKLQLHLTLALLLTMILLLINPFFDDDDSICTAVAILLVYTFLVTFTWMNVFAMDTWLVFRPSSTFSRSDDDGPSLSCYIILGWGIPLVLTSVSVIMEYVDVEDKFQPEFGGSRCWYTHKYAALLYFGIPVAISIIINTFLYIFTSINLRKAMRNALAAIKAEQYHITFYAWLFILMATTAVFAILSVFSDSDAIYAVFIVLASIQGIFLFVYSACARPESPSSPAATNGKSTALPTLDADNEKPLAKSGLAQL